MTISSRPEASPQMADVWVNDQLQELQRAGFGVAVLETVRPMLRLYATTGEGHRPRQPLASADR